MTQTQPPTVGMLGGGTMGAGIANVLLAAGVRVVLTAAGERVAESLRAAADRGDLEPDLPGEPLARLEVRADVSGLDTAALVGELGKKTGKGFHGW